MGTDLKKVGRGNKIKMALCGAGAVGSLVVFGFSIVGVIGAMLCGAGIAYFFKNLKIEYASYGKRF